MSDVLSVRIGGVEFDGTGDVHESTQFALTRDPGLFDGVEMRRPQTDRPQAHGQFWAPGFLSGRVITLEGEIYTNSPYEQDRAVARLVSLLADGGKQKMVVQRGAEVLSTYVARLSKPTVTKDLYGLLAHFQVTFWAPDPLWYGDQQSFGPARSLDLFHWGDFPAHPRFTVAGSSAAAGGYTIAQGGRSYVVSVGPAAGQTDEIDFATGWLYRNGALQSSKVSRYETWTVGPGVPETTTCTVPFSATVHDTYA